MNKQRNLAIAATLLVASLLALYLARPDREQPETLPEHKTGWIASDPEEIAYYPVLDTTQLSVPVLGFPPAFELDMPPVIDQGREGSCCACASAYAARSYLLNKDHQTGYTDDSGKTDLRKLFSPEFVYNSAKDTGTDDCSKAGMKLTHALDLMRNKGAATWAAMPYSGENGCAVQPDSAQLEQAAYFKVKKTERLDQPSERRIKQVLFNGNPVIFSARIDAGFMQNGSAVWKKSQLPALGGHAMVLCGWDDERHAYKVMNSWGTNWGDSGFGWIDYDHFAKVVIGKNGLHELFILSNGYDTTLLPEVRTLEGYQYSNALFIGEILRNGAAPITECGICYSRSPQPTINDSREEGMLDAMQIQCNPLQDLKNGTVYYIRAYARTMFGIAYGNELRVLYESESAWIQDGQGYHEWNFPQLNGK